MASRYFDHLTGEYVYVRDSDFDFDLRGRVSRGKDSAEDHQPVSKDPIVEKVISKMANRSEAGLRKYGVTMLRDDVSTIEWLRHAQEEALDFAVYIERIIHDLENKSD